MDVFSHGVWGYALSYPNARKEGNPKKAFWGVVAGMLPDLIPFLPVQIYFLVKGFNFDPGLFFPVPQHWVFSWAIESYQYTHSLVFFLVTLGIVLVARKGKMYWPLLAWGLHILMDIPTHPDFFQTPFLFPLSGFRFIHMGVSWANPWIFFPNWIILIALMVWIYIDHKRHSRTSQAGS